MDLEGEKIPYEYPALFFKLTNSFIKVLLVSNSCRSVPWSHRYQKYCTQKGHTETSHLPDIYICHSSFQWALTPTWHQLPHQPWTNQLNVSYLSTWCGIVGENECLPNAQWQKCELVFHTFFTVPSPTIFSLNPNGDFFITNIKAGIKPEHMALYGWAVFIELHFTASMWQAHLSKPG